MTRQAGLLCRPRALRRGGHFMRMARAWRRLAPLAIAMSVGSMPAGAEPATDDAATGGRSALIAVAANFVPAARQLRERFLGQCNCSLTLVAGSTGKQYAQIVAGAPFDAWFAADASHPQLLETTHRALPGSRYTYAVGRLVLWSAQPGYVDGDAALLTSQRLRHLAIANPRLAPYGAAARQTLSALGLWEQLQPRLVTGENVGQALRFVQSGAAEAGLVAWAQLHALVQDSGRYDSTAAAGSQRMSSLPGSWWLVPEHYHEPLIQQAVLLRNNAVAREFLAFVRDDPAAHALLMHLGYARRAPGDGAS